MSGEPGGPAVVGTRPHTDAVVPAASFEAFFRNERGATLAVVTALTGDRAAAEDITQEAFATALRKWSRIAEYDKPGEWVRRVAVNRAISRFRRRTREAAAIERLGDRDERRAADVASDPLDRLDGADDRLWVEVRRLPRRQAQVIALKYVNDLSTSEVAETLGCSEGAVKSHLHRAKQRLVTAMRPLDATEETDG